MDLGFIAMCAGILISVSSAIALKTLFTLSIALLILAAVVCMHRTHQQMEARQIRIVQKRIQMARKRAMVPGVVLGVVLGMGLMMDQTMICAERECSN